MKQVAFETFRAVVMVATIATGVAAGFYLYERFVQQKQLA